RASRVSPISAVSGNGNEIKKVRRGVRTGFFAVDTALGIHHAREDRKNLFLMTGSFALSIILFLTFTVLLDFVGYLLPQSASASDIRIVSIDGADSIPSEFMDAVRDMNGVDNIFGRRSLFGVPAKLGRDSSPESVDLISYENFDLEALKKDHMLKKGSELSKVCGGNDGAFIICDENAPLEIGGSIRLQGTALDIAGMLKYDIFSEDGLPHGKISVIVSDETFTRLTGIT
ncbi:MAG TPA: ABC transporter permease, partial [Lachnospiraceae bacterium]|nr:ABC transporter permease [Lachnospiraceae bacterium]